MTNHATGILPNRMLIAATHTHSAPAVMAAHATDPDEDYAEFMVAQIAEGIAQARKNLRPAPVGWAMGKDETNVFCRYLLEIFWEIVNVIGEMLKIDCMDLFEEIMRLFSPVLEKKPAA